MKLKWMFVLTMGLGGGLLSGCVGTVDGGHQAGNPFVKDNVEARYERTPQEIWTAAKDIIGHHGTLLSEDLVKNTLQANIDEHKVWIFIQEIDSKNTRVIVQARTKGGGGDVQLASYLNTEIAVRLTANNLTPATRPGR
jgi:hypothetical protein